MLGSPLAGFAVETQFLVHDLERHLALERLVVG
jgi:hypothetical protein